ncbi:MAG: pseudaminic acid synthase [Lachnospiraceae bacterium]|nr:pseudaminic acid synthase [Lachnospiraceae bacterium]
MNVIEIGGRKIGAGHPAYIIAEMSANHAGSLERAKEIIRKAKECGADCIKIQTYTADTITIDCHNSYFQIEGGTWEGENLYSLYNKAYTPWEWQAELKAEAERVGIDFFSTPFDFSAVDFLEGIGVGFYKIASYELRDIPLLRYVARTKKPMIISTGIAACEEIAEAVETIRGEGNEQIALLRCALAYPAIEDSMNLATMQDMGARFGVPVGLSDHSLGSLAAVTAVAMGGSIIEKHFCLGRDIENPDSSFSMEPAEFAEMVRDIRQAEKAKGIVYYGATEQEKENTVFRKSLFVVKDMKRGEIFTKENVRVIRPGYGLHPREYEHILGKRSEEDLERGTPLSASMVENYVTLVSAKEEQEELVFIWANEEETRKQSFSTEPISNETHHAWYGETLASDTRSLYICYYGETPVGLLRFDLLSDEEAEISYQIDVRFRGRGYAGAMLSAGEALLQETGPQIKKLSARVKPGNAASCKLLQKLGYEEKKRDANCVLYEKIL